MTAKEIRHGLRAMTMALILGLVLVAAASAQGTFYREVEKDGRIYVFNNMQQFSDWEKSGEMGVGITKPGVGPTDASRTAPVAPESR